VKLTLNVVELHGTETPDARAAHPEKLPGVSLVLLFDGTTNRVG
jgi:hypothetical protein